MGTTNTAKCKDCGGRAEKKDTDGVVSLCGACHHDRWYDERYGDEG